jgi:hypothetical protein
MTGRGGGNMWAGIILGFLFVALYIWYMRH